ncbi:MAG: CsbD family protein [Mycobacterium sp.]
MGITDKIRNAAEDAAGKVKEQVGKLTGDKDTEGEGKKDQAKSSVKKAGENVKDVFK